uniref:Neuronal PAS domain-containing protein 2 n=1 Tax=Ascaris suum TaxID=6253 RepID=F1KWJ5_ASCSU
MSDTCEQPISGHNVKRKTRNESEKRRRDAFNKLIGELTTLVADGDRKMDKSNVLKCAITFLKQRQLRAESTTEDVSCAIDTQLSRLTEYTPREIARLYVEALSAGTFCVACTGHLHHVSATFASFFSKAASEMRGMNLLDLLENESAKQLEQALSTEVFRAASACTSCNVPPTEAPLVRVTLVTRPFRKRILMLGQLKRVSLTPPLPSSPANESIPKEEPATGMDNDVHAPNMECDMDAALCLVGVARPLCAHFNAEISVETFSSLHRRSTAFVIVYNTRFICIQIDHNCSLLLGYGRLEMMGTSGYEYVHSDDLNTLADSHRILMQRGVHQLEAHRLCTKAGQWLWVKCAATIHNESPVARVTCVYSLTSPRPPSAYHSPRMLGQRLRSRVASRLVAPPTIAVEAIPPTTSMQQSSSQFTMGALRVSTAPLPVGISSCAIVGSAPSCPQTGDCSSTDMGSERRTPLTSPAEASRGAEVALINGTMKAESNASVAFEVVNTQRVKRKHTSDSLEGITESKTSTTVVDYASTSSQASPLVSPIGAESSPKKRVHPLVYIEHFPLSDTSCSRAALPSSTAALNPPATTNPIAVTDATPSAATDSPLAFSPMYRHVWEELQRKSDLLRQQVLQKELELQELHLKQFLSSLRGNKSI